jgi:hypothetical protein
MKSLVWILAGFPVVAIGQLPFDRIIAVPGDTMSANGTEHRVIIAANGDLIFSDWFQFENGPGPAINTGFVHRMTANGALIWRKRLTMPTAGQFRLARLRELSDGSIVVVGTCSAPTNRGFLVRFDASGATLSLRQYQNGPGCSLSDVAALNDSTLVLLGSISNPPYGSLIVRTDLDGDVIGSSTVQFTGVGGGGFNKLTPCADGSFVLSGMSQRIVNPDTTLYNVLVARMDNTGAVPWAERLEERVPSGLFSAPGAYRLPDNSLRLFARSRIAGAFQDDLWMIALNEQGGIQWKERIRFPSIGAGFNAVASVSLDESTYWLAGSYLGPGRCNVVIDTSGTVISAGATSAGDMVAVYDVTSTVNGSPTTLSLGYAPGSTTAFVPRIIRDQTYPILCSPYSFTFRLRYARASIRSPTGPFPLRSPATSMRPRS